MNEVSVAGGQGFAMPPEWAPHARTWMAWPCPLPIWPDLARTRRAYVSVARAIRAFEPVMVVARPKDAAEARKLLGPSIDLVEIDIDDSWIRDTGPTFLVDRRGRLAGTNFCFNAWGGKYPQWKNDDRLASEILSREDAGIFTSGLVSEGGAIHVDGEGTLLTTESCLFNANRNPGWTKAEIEAELKTMLGVTKVVWLPGNPLERETDGHVDLVAAFVKPGVVLADGPGDPDHPEYQYRRANIEALRAATDARGRQFEIVTIDGAYDAVSGSSRFSRSYINFYIVNGGLIMPAYNTKSDRAASETFRRVFADRTVVAVPVADIAIGGGGIHCITQQQPVFQQASRSG